jgi:nucleoside-diphosphate-sugar epimerase
MKQLILVHGAENFVGRRLVAALSESDWAEPLPVDTLDMPALSRAVGTADAVVQCVVGSAPTIERGATEIYGALMSRRARPRVVHLSSMTVYGSATGRVDENSELRADLGPYSQAQVAAERIGGRYENAVILRPGGEYGPGCPHWTLRIARLLLARRLGDLGSDGDGYCNLLYIDDLIGAILRALRVPDIGGQCFNLAVAAPPTWNEYFVNFARALRAVHVRRITHRRLSIEKRLYAPMLKGLELAFKLGRLPAQRLPPPISPSMVELCRHEIQLDVCRAERILGLSWTDTQQGLERAAAWCRESLDLR